MNNKFRVIQVGLGPMGKIITKLLIKRKNINLIGVIDIDPQFTGKNLSKILETDVKSDLVIISDLETVLTKGKADIVIIATSSSLDKVAPLINTAAKSACNVISICEELSYPFQHYPKLSEELDVLAKKNEITILGTGINPGYLMDLLPIVITAPCQNVKSIKVTRMMNSSKRRVPFQKKIGTGLSVQEFHKRISNKEITGHVGLKESIQMIISALGIDYDEIIELSPKEVITKKEIKTSYGEVVSIGNVCGLQSKAFAKKNGYNIVSLDFVAYAGDHEEYDSIMIEGTPDIVQNITGGVHGDLGTSAMVANLIPIVTMARPGLLTMKDIPVPRYTENIWKKDKKIKMQN
ncbi:MAG: NAD(P)H-dependent amine dehydrogenase family protein [Promethearchaeota archaeon]|jgi:4-hydroxy-tetrahydrodipicolinate reductase